MTCIELAMVLVIITCTGTGIAMGARHDALHAVYGGFIGFLLGWLGTVMVVIVCGITTIIVHKIRGIPLE